MRESTLEGVFIMFLFQNVFSCRAVLPARIVLLSEQAINNMQVYRLLRFVCIHSDFSNTSAIAATISLRKS